MFYCFSICPLLHAVVTFSAVTNLIFLVLCSVCDITYIVCVWLLSCCCCCICVIESCLLQILYRYDFLCHVSIMCILAASCQVVAIFILSLFSFFIAALSLLTDWDFVTLGLLHHAWPNGGCLGSYCNMLEWFLCNLTLSQWPAGLLQCFVAAGWVIWPVKTIPEMTYNVSSRTLSLRLLTPDYMPAFAPFCGLFFKTLKSIQRFSFVPLSYVCTFQKSFHIWHLSTRKLPALSSSLDLPVTKSGLSGKWRVYCRTHISICPLFHEFCDLDTFSNITGPNINYWH